MDPPAPTQPHPQSSSASSPRATLKLPSFPAKIRLMCSYGGHIVPRPHDKSLCYVGGDTRIVIIDRRNPSLSSLLSHLSKTLHQPLPFSLKYQLPNEELDSLISLSSDDDLENLLDEFDRLNGPLNSSAKPARIRLFLFSHKIEGSRSVGLPVKASEDWFLNALNCPGAVVGISRGFSDPVRVDCLLGLNEEAEDEEDDDGEEGYADVRVGDDGDIGPGNGGTIPNLGIGGGGDKGEKNLRSLSQQDVHSVPDSPMLETTSSFGSTSSSPSVANSGVRVEETSGMEQKLLGIEEQFGQVMPFSAVAPHNVGGAVATMGVGVMGVAELGSRVVSDDERSDRGGVDGARKALGPSPVLVHQRNVAAVQMQQNLGGGGGAMRANGIELASPDSVSSDNSFTNSGPRQKPTIYYDQVVQMPSGVGQVPTKPVDPNLIISDTSTRAQPQQHITDSRYILQPQHAQQPQPIPQQFVPATSQYIPQHPASSVPVAAYYAVYPSQHHQLHQSHQLDQQFPVYYMPVSQMQPYNFAAKQQPGGSESATTIASTHLQMTAQNPALIQQSATYTPSTCASVNTKAEVAGGGVYLTGAASNTALVQVPAGQLQSPYVGFSHLHHQPPVSGAPPTYGYELQNPAPAQIYYAQPPVPVASQYQTMPPGTGNAVMLLKASDQLPNDVTKQQLRVSQPL